MCVLQVLLGVVCSQFIRVYDLSTDAAAPKHTFYLPATAEDASGDGAGSYIRDVEMVPAETASMDDSTPLATAVVLTGAGKLYSKEIPSLSIPEGDSGEEGGGAGVVGYTRNGEIRHRLIIPSALEEDAGSASEGVVGSAGSSSGGSGGGSSNRDRSKSVGGSNADVGSCDREDDYVESPVSPPESPGYLYLNAFGCDFDEAGNDSADEGMIFTEPGMRRKGWTTSSSPAAATSSAEVDIIRGGTQSVAEASNTGTAASSGALFFSVRMGLLVVARNGRSTLALRLRGAGASVEICGGFVLLPRAKSSGGSGAVSSRINVEGGVTPSSGQGSTPGADRVESSDGAAAAAAAVSAVTAVAAAASMAAARTILEANSCLPPYTRFLDYWDGSNHLVGEGGIGVVPPKQENGAKKQKKVPSRASLVCVASGGGMAKTDRVLAMRVGARGGDGLTVRDDRTCDTSCIRFNIEIVSLACQAYLP